MLPVTLLPIGSIKIRDEYKRYLLAVNVRVSNRTNLQTQHTRTVDGLCERLQTHMKRIMNIQIPLKFGGRGGDF